MNWFELYILLIIEPLAGLADVFCVDSAQSSAYSTKKQVIKILTPGFAEL